MTGYCTTVDGSVWRLPPLIRWDVIRTDGSACDSAVFTFLYEPAFCHVLKSAWRFRLEEDGATVLAGIVDEVTAEVGEHGRLATLSGRGDMALLMDNQLRAAQFSLLQKEDVITRFVKPFGVTQVRGGNLRAVPNFAVDTGTTAWEAVKGFCRHSGNYRPRFTADGILLLDGGAPASWAFPKNAAFQTLCYDRCRYGAVSEQVLISTGGGIAETARNSVFTAQNGCACKVGQLTGNTTRATWRNAAQRVEDSMENWETLTVTLAGRMDCEPGDRIHGDWEEHGITGDYFLRSRREKYESGQRRCILELKGAVN